MRSCRECACCRDWALGTYVLSYAALSSESGCTSWAESWTNWTRYPQPMMDGRPCKPQFCGGLQVNAEIRHRMQTEIPKRTTLSIANSGY
eukprot:2373951-Rhodomonas_salina.2